MASTQDTSNREIVDEGTRNSTQETGNDRNPPIVISKTKTTSDHRNPETRTKITSWINSKTGIETERKANGGKNKTNNERIQVALYWLVACIHNGKDQTNKKCCADKLATESPKQANEWLRACVENATNRIQRIS